MKEIPVKPIDVQSSQPTSRRAFCQQCGAASLAALGLLVPGCGGGNPAGPSGVGAAQLPSISTTIANNAFMLTIDGSSPLNAVGSAALVQASGKLPLPGCAHRPGYAHRARGDLNLRGVDHHRLPGRQLHLSVPRVRLQHVGPGAGGTGAARVPLYTTAFANGVLTVS